MNNKGILSRLTKENGFCADCSAKDPKYASITFGVFICAECSGVHRSLQNGTLSLVKSIDANFTASEIGSLSQMGNQKVNEILEYNTSSMHKPNPKSPYGDKERWINMKYIEQRFSSKQNFQLQTSDRIRSSSISTIRKQGFLNKKGGSVKSWKRRYFVLSPTYISYYKAPGDPIPVGVIQLLFSSVRTFPEERDKENCFGVITSARTYIFQADTAGEIAPWIDSIKEAITMANSGNIEKQIDSSGNEESDIVEGFLLKEGNNVVKDWKKRWFVLQGENLHYYNKKNDRSPLGVIVLASCSAKVSESKSKRFCIEIITPTRSYWVAAENAEEMHQWIRAIRNASKNILQGRFNEDAQSSNSPQINCRESYVQQPQPTPVVQSNIPPPVPRMRPTSYQVPRGSSSNNITPPHIPNAIQSPNSHASINASHGNNSPVLTKGVSHGAIPMKPPAVPSRPQPPARHSTFNSPSSAIRHPIATSSQAPVVPNNNNSPSHNSPKANLERKFATQPNLFNMDRVTSTASITPSEPLQPKQGWLNKMGNNMIKDWQKRFVIVKPNAIEYFKNKLDAIPAGVIPLNNVHVHANQNVRSSCFEVATPNRSYYFAADNPIEMNSWISTISAYIQVLNPADNSGDKNNSGVNISALSAGGTFTGWILKQGKKGLKPWRRRWACLKGDNLYYYNNENDEEPLGVISVLLCTVKTTEQGGSFFDIVTPNRIYHFQAKDKSDLLNWITHIRTASEQLYNELPSTVPADQFKVDDEEKNTTQDNNRERIKELANLPENKKCADCFNPDPDWASINLGIFICIECAGAHRTLGVHLSKVRSLTLDRWEPEVIEFMAAMGNELSNSIYEYLIPQSYPRPTNADSREEREKFIRLKYETATWADPSKVQKGAGPVKKNLMALYKAGYLTKQGNSIKTWKRRWFVLKLTDDTASLFYYKIRGDATPAGGIDIKTSAVRSPVLGLPHTFEIITPNRIYCITAATDEERDSWVERLREIIELYDSKSM